MKSQLPALIMLLSEFRMPLGGMPNGSAAASASIQPQQAETPARSAPQLHRFPAAHPHPYSNGAGSLTQHLWGGAISARSKKKRFG